MNGIRILTAAEQVAEHLRAEILGGRLAVSMPGVLHLEKKLGVNRNTLEAALRHLEQEGLLVPQGAGKRREIVIPGGKLVSRPLRVGLLHGETADRRLDYIVELQHQLEEAGHSAVSASRSMVELGMDVKRIARMVAATGADAWVVLAGGREVLEWFISREIPAFALFGRRNGLLIAGVGPDKRPAYAAAVRKLVSLGHRRIVLMARPRRRLPVPGASEQAFMDELAAHGITPGPYHLPDWEDTIESFHARLESLFRVTPPTALIVDEAPLYLAALQFCASRGIRIPDAVSFVCTDADATFDWCQPPVSHIRWDSAPVVRRVLRWAGNVSRGKQDLRQTLTRAEFVESGMIGPAKEGDGGGGEGQ